MSRVVAIGSELQLAGYALAGVEVAAAEDAAAARRAWSGLGTDVGLVLLTPGAAASLPDRVGRAGLLCVVLPG
jgi:vacuolar-type H+-ATPase subunit F/Vma7